MNSISAAFSPLSASPYAPVGQSTGQSLDESTNDAMSAATKSGRTPFAGVLANHMKPKAAKLGAPSEAIAVDDAADGTAIADAAPEAGLRGRGATAALRAMVEQVADSASNESSAPSPSAPSNSGTAAISESSALEIAIQAVIAGRTTQTNATAETAGTHTTAEATADDTRAPSKDAPVNDGIAERAATDALRRAAELNPTLIVRDPQVIDPELKAKVDRVITRMKAETGHEVTIVESWRSQTRQNALHAQGRTAAGPIVTWTRHSLHTSGEAVDVMIDGKYDNTDAFKQLQRIANDEGLHTLGARDPGHLELVSSKGLTQLASGVTIAGAQLGSTMGSTNDGTANGTVGGNAAEIQATLKLVRDSLPASTTPAVAVPATVAAVAEVSTVASVARVAQADTAIRAAATNDDASTAESRRPIRSARTARQGAALNAFGSSSATTGRENSEVRLAMEPSIRLTGANSLPVPAAARVVDAGARVAQVFGLQDAKAAQPMSSLLLRVDNGAGGEDRIRVDLRGTTVGASIDMRDADAAQQLAKNLPDLTRSLEARGLDTGALRVRAIAAAGMHEEGVLRLPTINTESGRSRPDALSTASGSSTKPSHDDAPQDGPKHQPSRQRSRRDQKGEAQ
jgi:uncharacterized protein YcbK (DUF882 family)